MYNQRRGNFYILGSTLGLSISWSLADCFVQQMKGVRMVISLAETLPLFSPMLVLWCILCSNGQCASHTAIIYFYLDMSAALQLVWANVFAFFTARILFQWKIMGALHGGLHNAEIIGSLTNPTLTSLVFLLHRYFGSVNKYKTLFIVLLVCSTSNSWE